MEKLKQLSRAEELVSLECLGLCEHCEIPLSFENAPMVATDLDWRCPSCDGLLTAQTFGYKEIEGKWKKVRWVGPEGKWVDEQPVEDFITGFERARE